MSYTEKQFQSDFTKWLRAEHSAGRQIESAAYELKVKKHGQRLNFKSDFQPQQLPKLQEASSKECVSKKLSDADPTLKPFDMFSLCRSGAYVVVLWYQPRAPKEFIMIPIDILIAWRRLYSPEKKSIIEEEAIKLGQTYQL